MGISKLVVYLEFLYIIRGLEIFIIILKINLVEFIKIGIYIFYGLVNYIIYYMFRRNECLYVIYELRILKII